MSDLIDEAGETELVWLRDTTGSQTFDIRPGVHVRRADVMKDAARIFVDKLAERDSQMGKPNDEGGIYTIAFAKSSHRHPGYVDQGDINQSNFDVKMAEVPYTGATFIMPAWRAMLAHYNEEFAAANPKPNMRVLISTDGALDTNTVDAATGLNDEQAFQAALSDLPDNWKVELCIVGEGSDNYGVVDTYHAIEHNSHGKLKVVPLQRATDPNVIAKTMLEMVGF